MQDDVRDKLARFKALEAEELYKQRKRAEEAANIAAALHRLTESEIAVYEASVPGIREIVDYTEQQLFDNRNGEAQKVATVFETMKSKLDSWLKHYEGNIC